MSAVSTQSAQSDPKLSRYALVGTVAAAPLLAGALIPQSVIGDGPKLCLLREALGIPCPFCGATRAFIEFGHGSADWLTYNGYWVIVSLAVLLFSLLLIAATLTARGPGRLPEKIGGRVYSSRLVTPLVLLAVTLPGWIWAFANFNRIVG
jgi:hypothetical protein